MAEERTYAELVRGGAFLDSPEGRLNLGALGLAGESGEVVDLIKKRLFHGKELNADHLREELGDVLWYLTLLADCIGVSLQALAFENILKLHERYPKLYPSPVSDIVVRL